MRVPNFDVRLAEWATALIGRPFAWGVTDCASLVRQAIGVCYGTEPPAPTYQTKAEALRVLAATGGVAAVLERWGAETLPLAFAQSGDVVIGPPIADEGGAAAAFVVVAPGQLLVTDPELGIRVAPIAQAPEGATLRRLPFEWAVPAVDGAAADSEVPT